MDEAHLLIGGLGAFLVLLAFYLNSLRFDYCARCEHCKAEDRRKAEEQKKLQDEYASRVGLKSDKKDDDDGI